VNDPVGLINNANNPAAARHMDAAQKLHAQRQKQADTTRDADAAGFRDLLMQNLARVNELQQDATQAVEDLSTGKRDDLETVLMATQKADTAFRMLLQVRNQVMQAYDEVKQIRV
jgi:flagellar hook-basal body complex protein FliE